MNVDARIKKVMSQIFSIDEKDISAESSKDSIENWDSINHMSLITSLEEEFGIIFTDTQVVEMLNYQLIKAILKEHNIDS